MVAEVEISVIIPTRDDAESLKKILEAIHNQTFIPKEIVIVDSSTNSDVECIVEGSKWTVPIVYHIEKKAYPGKARNVGVQLANGDWIAFLDSRTIPKKDWLQRYYHLVQVYHSEVVFGVTQFESASPFQKTLRAATYGKIGHHTVPGTLIMKNVFNDSGRFLEHVRMGEDIEWRERLTRSGFTIHRPDESVVTYHGLPDNFNTTLRKYVKSAYHTARLNILRNVKDAYLSFVIILSAIILPKWNHLIEGWDVNPLFIPHITKIYLMALVCLLLIYQLLHYLVFRNIPRTLFSRTLKIMVIIFITLAVYKWNAIIAGWMEDAVLYVPHITKLYVGSLILVSVLYRGIILPLKRKVEPGFLFPFRWIKVSLLGLFLDLAKAPGYLFGAIRSFFK